MATEDRNRGIRLVASPMERSAMGDLVSRWLPVLGILLLSACSNPGTVPTAGGKAGWDRIFGGDGRDEATDIAAALDGGYIVAGWTNSQGAGRSDGWLMKVDAWGVVEWQNTYGGPGIDKASAVAADPDGGFVVAGWTRSRGAGKDDFWVLKVDGEGRIEWERTFGGADDDQAHDIVLTADGGYALAGWTGSQGSGRNDAWILKLDGAGGIEWDRTYGGTGDDQALALQATPDRGFVVAGWRSPGPGRRTAAWVLRLDERGGTQWEKTPATGDVSQATDVQVTDDLGIVLAGWTQVSSGAEPWISRLGPTGSRQWTRRFAIGFSDRFKSVDLLPDGDIVAAGETYRRARSIDAWFVRLDSRGRVIWNRHFGGGSNDDMNALLAVSDGRLVAAGRNSSDSAGGFDAWLIQVPAN